MENRLAPHPAVSTDNPSSPPFMTLATANQSGVWVWGNLWLLGSITSQCQRCVCAWNSRLSPPGWSAAVLVQPRTCCFLGVFLWHLQLPVTEGFPFLRHITIAAKHHIDVFGECAGLQTFVIPHDMIGSMLLAARDHLYWWLPWLLTFRCEFDICHCCEESHSIVSDSTLVYASRLSHHSVIISTCGATNRQSYLSLLQNIQMGVGTVFLSL